MVWRKGRRLVTAAGPDDPRDRSSRSRGVSGAYGAAFAQVALVVGASLIGVVLFGTLAGAMLPLALRTCGLDPASASAPAVATMVDVTGLVIDFTIAKLFLLGGGHAG